MDKSPYKVGQYIVDKKRPYTIHEILKIDVYQQKAFIRNIDPKVESSGAWNSFRVLKKYLDILHGYNTPLWKVIND